MPDKLDAYLEEISHFLSGQAEREEILQEIRSHILEKAAEGPGELTDAALERAIAAFGPARRVAERYLDEGRPIIAPVFKRYLVRYTSLLFAFHTLLTAAAVAFKKDFVLFPFIYMPRLGVAQALMYLPTAFLADLGLVTVVLYFITQSGKDVRLPWPKFAVDIEDVKPPTSVEFWANRIATAVVALVMLGLTDFALYVFAHRQTIFFVNLDWKTARPLFTPGAGRYVSLVVIAMFALSTSTLFLKLFIRTRWVDVVSDVLSLAFIGLLLRQPFEGLFAVRIPERLLPKVKFGLDFALIFIASMIALDLIKRVILIGRGRLRRARPAD